MNIFTRFISRSPWGALTRLVRLMQLQERTGLSGEQKRFFVISEMSKIAGKNWETVLPLLIEAIRAIKALYNAIKAQ